MLSGLRRRASDPRRRARVGAVALLALAGAALLQAATMSEPPGAMGSPAVRPAPATVRHAARPALGPVAVVPAGRSPVHVPILMYHYIRTNPDPRDRLGFNLSVTPDDFGRQMDWLAANGYHPIDLGDLRAYLLDRSVLPDRSVVLTFDDGYRDLYTAAYPVLRAHGFKAVSYVVSGFVGSPSSVTAAQVLEMDANGIEIGAHTVSHADLSRLAPADLRHEVVDSRASLEALLGHPVLDFCYPYGHLDAAVVSTVEAAGFLTATTTQPGADHSAGDRFAWTRVRVGGGESLEQFAADLGSPEASQVVAVSAPLPAALHGPSRRPVTLPLLPPRGGPRGAPAVLGPLP
jgi:peptidoglycan/xylan/chitin deacetylase (PgdA/CDA1 family)